LRFSRFITSKSLIINEEEKRRSEQLEALRIEQGGSDEEDVQYLGEAKTQKK
jgi:hypothetical protein